MSTASDIHEIERRLQRMKPAEVTEVKDFVEFLSRKGSPAKSEKKIAKLKGIWKGLGFEKLDLEKDIKAMRKEFDEGILRRSERWSI
jgi:hypothetical protein